ncbi:MAG: hypothetical protein ABSA43_02035 [Candidatus Microgenomates bacterium]|jgi:hypothetical protein
MSIETRPGQTQDRLADEYRNSSNKHFKKQIVPVGVLVLFGLADHLIPKGVPTTLEEVAIGGYVFEYARQAYLGVRDLRRAERVKKSGGPVDNTSGKNK